MSHSAAVVLPHAGLLTAPVPRNRGALPPVCPPPEPRRRTPTSSSLSWPQLPPRLRVMTPLLPPAARRRSPTARTHVLPKRLRLA